MLGDVSSTVAFGRGELSLGKTRKDAAPLVRPRQNATARAFLGIACVSTVLTFVVTFWPIPPLVESDYAYLLTAADRFVDGNGLTTTPPLAPHQLWQWRGDWTYLTQWPVGYSLIVAGVRTVFGVSSIEACRWISLIACAVALVGWFTWSSQLIPPCLTRSLFASACAGLSLPVAWLVNPTTDLIVVAALPWLMMASSRCVLNMRRFAEGNACGSGGCGGPYGKDGSENRVAWRQLLFLAWIGLAAGLLFWIRYASVFVPLGIGAHLVGEWFFRRGVRCKHVLVFAATSVLPIAALLVVNAVWGAGESTRSQLNLGDHVGFDLTFSTLWRAWWMFTDLGYYAHRAIAHWTFALVPIAIVVGTVTIHPLRRSAGRFLSAPAVSLSVMVVFSLLAMLIAAKALFSSKFDYVGLARYYQPIKPLYLAFVLAPFVACGKRWVRGGMCVFLVLACSWTLQQNWLRTYQRWNHAMRSTTPSGAWSRCFEPGAGELFEWVKERCDPSLVVASNFHEFVEFETGTPAIPTPPDRETLDRWLTKIQEARGIDSIHVVFALDPSNRWRDHWLAAPSAVVAKLGLVPMANVPPVIARYLFELPPTSGRSPIDSLSPHGVASPSYRCFHVPKGRAATVTEIGF